MKNANHPRNETVSHSTGAIYDFRRWTIGRRVAVGFTLVILIAAGLGAFALLQVRVLSGEFSKVVDKNIPGLERISRVQVLATQNRLLVFKHISSGSKEDMLRLEQLIADNSHEIGESLDAYAKLSITAKERATDEVIQTVRAEYLSKIKQILDLSRSNADNLATYALARAELDPIALRYAAALKAASDNENASAQENAAVFQASMAATQRGVAVGLLLAVLIGSIIGYFINRSTAKILRSISDSLADGANQVSSSSQQVSAASQALAEGASEQAASLEETGSSLEEMAGMTRRNSENSAKANEFATQARRAADAGAADMQAMKDAMGDIKTSGDDIAKIIKTIDEIAFQTNILALNAAVEAARAGSSGAGFAVVADEVRALAQRSAQASQETADKIEGSLTKTALGVAISERVGRSLFEIVDKVREVDQLIAEVNTASREQSQGVDQINSAVSQMDKVVQSSASSAEETAAAAEELSAQAQLMREGVVELLNLVGGSSAEKEAPAQVRGNRRSLSVARRATPQVMQPMRNFRPKSFQAQTANGGAASLTFKDF